MQQPGIPPDEAARLESLQKLMILDTPIDEAFERITRLTKAVYQVPIVAISLIDTERQWFKSIQGLDACETSREVSFCGHAILQDKIFIIEDATKDERFMDNPLVTGPPYIRYYAGYPIESAAGHRIGTLCIIDTKPHSVTQDKLNLLQDFAELAQDEINKYKSSHAQNFILRELDASKRDSLIDPLTRLWNREGISQILTQQMAQSEKTETPFGIALADIDHFKKINDTYGHNAGDQVLRMVSKYLLKSCSEEDAVGRWGGEEFVIIINNSSPQRVEDIIQRARKRLQSTLINFDDFEISISATFGLTMVEPDSPISQSELINKIDKALYKGKQSGRNRVVLTW